MTDGQSLDGSEPAFGGCMDDSEDGRIMEDGGRRNMVNKRPEKRGVEMSEAEVLRALMKNR